MRTRSRAVFAAIALCAGCDDLFNLVRVPSDGGATDDSRADAPDPRAIVQIGVGGGNSCARLGSGEVRCWGQAQGAASTSDQPLPVTIIPAEAIDIAVGDGGACATFASGIALCWGENPYGELATNIVGPVLIPSPVVEQSGESATDVKSVAVGNGVSCALRTNGRVSCAGSAGLLGDGSTLARGSLGEPVRDISDATQLAAGNRHVCALRMTGQILCWGDNSKGQLGVAGVPSSGIPILVDGTGYSAVTAGDEFSCGLHAGGTVSCWGGNAEGQLGDAQTGDSATPVTVVGVDNAIAIAGGAFGGYVLRSSNVASAWGSNAFGQLGDGTFDNARTGPTNIQIDNAVEISSGTGVHACARTSDSRMYCWGNGGDGQLGRGTVTMSAVPEQVLGLPTL